MNRWVRYILIQRQKEGGGRRGIRLSRRAKVRQETGERGVKKKYTLKDKKRKRGGGSVPHSLALGRVPGNLWWRCGHYQTKRGKATNFRYRIGNVGKRSHGEDWVLLDQLAEGGDGAQRPWRASMLEDRVGKILKGEGKIYKTRNRRKKNLSRYR